MKRPTILLLYAQSEGNRTFSYQYGWPRHFMRHSRFHCIPLNVLDRTLPQLFRRQILVRRGRFDAVVMLHSVFSNACNLRHFIFDAVRSVKVPKAYFIGNEYKLMPDKMEFCDGLGVSLLISQTASPAVHALYRERLGCFVTGIPNTGLDTDVFKSEIPFRERPIDIGYRADDSPIYLGHYERPQIADYFLQHGPRYGLSLDISLEQSKRLPEGEWAGFLNRCKGQLGTEAGGDYFEITDETRLKYRDYNAANPGATNDEIISKFFKGYPNPVPIRIISGRNVEAAGTKTVQILFEGHYDGYFKPDVHYIPLKKDFSNFTEVMEKFRDEAYCRTITDNAYELAVKELTYAKLIDRFYDAFTRLL